MMTHTQKTAALWALGLLGASPAFAIAGGTETDQPDGVVGLRFDAVGVFCSGTLIADTWVLTQTDCLGISNYTTPKTPAEVLIGAEADTAAVVEVVAFVPHPDTAKLDPYGFDPRGLVLLELAAPAPATPLPLSQRSDGDLAVGEAVTLHGWGATSYAGDDPRHRTGSAEILEVDAGIVTTSGASNFCFYDAGGPVLDASGEVVGIAAGIGNGCGGGLGFSVALDTARDWIVATAGLPEPTTDTGTLDTATTDTGPPLDTGALDTGSPTTTGPTPTTEATDTNPTHTDPTGTDVDPATGDGDKDDGGCGCQASPWSSGWPALVVLLGLRRRG